MYHANRRSYRQLGLVSALVLIAWVGKAQLVNAGFEESTAMPSAPGMWHLLPGWNNAGSGSSTPDFFHLDGMLGGDLPETPVALVQPFEGRGIAGLTAIRRNAPGVPLSREYLVMDFASPLVIGQHYSLSFAVANGQWLPTSGAGLSVNGLGIALTVEPPVQMGQSLLDLPPVFQIPYARYDAAWEVLTFTFQATSPSQHMVVGVFGADADLDAEVAMGENPTMAYYFLDDFNLTPVDDAGEPAPALIGEKGPEPVELEEAKPVFVPNAFSPNGDGLNDWFIPEVGTVLPKSFDIFSRWGQLVISLDPADPKWDGLGQDGVPVEGGVYIWRLEWPRSVPREQRTQQGAVTLLR